MEGMPTGTVTFLSTDLEGSTKLWERHPDDMRLALSRHDALLRSAIEVHGGRVFKTVGDGVFASFATAAAAASAAAEIQRSVADEPWGPNAQLKVRIALHSGVAEERDGDYFGPTVNRAARLLAAGHGGQTLLSNTAYELVRDHLAADARVTDLGEHRLKDLSRPERVWQLVLPDLPTEFPPLKSLNARPNNLPAQMTAMVGREKELHELRVMLLRPDVRLVTLTGAGGTGKTRVALQVAAELVDDFSGGVYFVPLAAISDSSVVASAVASALGIEGTGNQGSLERLRAFLQDRAILMVLDNLEQVMAARSLITDLLTTCRGLKVLATSREVLHLSGEKGYPVPPLELPDPKRLPRIEVLSQYESVQFFIQRAMDAKPDFAVTNENAAAVADICHRLDGLPLAIELAAARIRLLPPEALRQRLSSRLRLLTGGAWDLPARHQTIRETIAWSYELLSEPEKHLFARVAVFSGGFSLDTARAVCAVDSEDEIELLDRLSSLVEKSLLRQRDEKGEPRFTSLETIREFGLDCLAKAGGLDEPMDQHKACFLTLAESAAPKLHGPEQATWARRLECEMDNLRQAMEWCLSRADVADAERLTLALWYFWLSNGYFGEGITWLGRTLELRKQMKLPSSSAIYFAAGLLAYRQGDTETASAYGDIALQSSNEGGAGRRADALYLLGLVAFLRGDVARARGLLEESFTIFRSLGTSWAAADSLRSLASIEHTVGQLRKSADIQGEALTLSKACGDHRGVAESLRCLGRVARDQCDYGKAEALATESLEVCRSLGDKWGVALALSTLRQITAERTMGRAEMTSVHAEAFALYRELEQEVTRRPFSLGDLVYLSDVDIQRMLRELDMGELEPAMRSAPEEVLTKVLRNMSDGAGSVLRSEITKAQGAPEDECERAAQHVVDVVRLLEESGDIRVVRGPSGEAMADPLRDVHAQDAMAFRALWADDVETARKLYRSAAETHRAMGSFEVFMADTLLSLGFKAARGEKHRKAARLFGSAEAMREATGSPLRHYHRDHHEGAIAAIRSALGDREFEAAWSEGHAMAPEVAVESGMVD